MKKVFFLLVAMTGLTSTVMAQDGIKRPDSYYYQSGVDAYDKKDYSKSLDFFDKELQNNPKNGYAHLLEAYIHEGNEQYGNAMSSVNKAIKYIPKKDKQWVGMSYGLRASVLAELGDTAKALSDYDHAIKKSSDTKYIFDKCNILYAQNKLNEIDKALKLAKNIDENNPTVWVHLGRNDDAKGDYQKAIEHYNYAAKLAPDYSSAYSFRAATYMKTRQYNEACKDVIRALDIDGDDKAYMMLYTLADSAMTVLSTQLKAKQLKDPNNYKWSYYRGLMQSHIEDYAAAESSFKDAIAIAEYQGVNRLLIYQNLSETLAEQGKYIEALEKSDICISIDSTEVRSWNDRGEILFELGKHMEAIECFNTAIKLSPEDDYLYYKRFRQYKYKEIFSNALDDINTAISLEPDYSFYLVHRGKLNKYMGNVREMENDCRKVVEMEMTKPEDEREMLSLAYAYALMGDKTTATPLIDKIYEGKETRVAEYDRACLCCLIGDSESALKHLEKALRAGFCCFEDIRKDKDFDIIREHPTFKQLIDEYQKKYTELLTDDDGLDGDYVEETTEVPFVKENGVCNVKCSINGLPLHFCFDTGASGVTISSVEAQFMLKNGYLKSADIKGKKNFVLANGEIDEGTVIVLRNVNFGGLKIENVRASVVHNQNASLLLGQTLLGRLGKIEIDNNRNVLKITSRKKLVREVAVSNEE